MGKKTYAVFLLTICSFILPAEEYNLANDADNDISLNTNSGILNIRRFGGISPQQPLRLGEDVFTTKQMETKAAETVWEISKKTNEAITISTLLRKDISGIDLDGVKYRKTFQFIPSVPEIRVTMDFHNTSGQVRYAYWGIRNQFQQRPNIAESVFIPRTIGTFPHSIGSFLQFYAKPPAWTSSTAENWCAKMDIEGKAGIAFLLDPVFQGAFYTLEGKNVGFMLDGGYMAPGAEVSSTYVIRPVKHLGEVTTVNQSFAAGINDSGKKIQLFIFPYSSGQLSCELEIVDKDRKSIFRKSVELTLEKGSIEKFELEHPKISGHSAVVFSGKLNGKTFSTEQYCENGVRMQGVFSSAFMPYFFRPALERKNTDGILSGIGKVRKNQAVCLFGLFTPLNRFDKILKGWKIDDYSVWDVGMKEIPPASTLDEYSVMIISNAFVSGMEVCLQRIKSFVANGGVLIVTGGPSAFGTGGYEKNSVLKEILPVSGRAYDLQPVAGREQFDKGVSITGRGIDAANAPSVYWVHQFVEIRPAAEVLWNAGEKPILVKGSFGKGKVICFLGSPLGDPQDGSVPYWESEEYVKGMRDVIMSALKEDKK